MKCILLAAGYGTRITKMIGDIPKCFVEYKGEKVVTKMLRCIEKIDKVDEIYLVTNNRYYNQFVTWAKSIKHKKRLTIINDHTNAPEERLGAVGDFGYVIEKKNIQDDVLLCVTDLVYKDSELFKNFVEFFDQKKTDATMGIYREDKSLLTSKGVIKLDKRGFITEMEEKPAVPKSNIEAEAYYIYTQKNVAKVSDYLKQFKGDRKMTDPPGSYTAYLVSQGEKIACFMIEDEFYDFGTEEILRQHKEDFKLKK